jgi:HK97 family phage major capsid protein
MVDIQKIIDLRVKLHKEMQDMLTEAEKRNDGGFTAEETAKYQKLEAAFDEATEQKRRFEDAEKRSRDLSALNVDPSLLAQVNSAIQVVDANQNDKEYRDAFNAWLKGGALSLSGEQRQILQSRAQSVGTNSAGGYLVEPTMASQITTSMKLYSSMLQAVTTLNTAGGDTINHPTVDDTANKGELIAENTAVASQDVTFGNVALRGYIFSSKLVLVPLTLMQDSAFDLNAYLGQILSERLGRIINQYLTTGTGSSQPTGIAAAGSVGKTGATGQTASIIYDDLVDLVYSVDPAYRVYGSFMAANATIAAIRKLQDGHLRPLWQPAVAAGQPDTLLGFPLLSNPEVATMAANAKSLFFGDFTKYVFRNVTGMPIMQLRERYAEYFQVGFIGFARGDGNLTDSKAIKWYANSAT